MTSNSDITNENFGNTYNPAEQILELSKEKTALYERMLELEKKNRSSGTVVEGEEIKFRFLPHQTLGEAHEKFFILSKHVGRVTDIHTNTP